MKETGIDFPKLKLGDVEHTIRFTRGAFAYHMSKKGLEFSDLRSSLKVTGTLVDVLMFAMTPPFVGTPEDLAEVLIEEKKMKEANVLVHVALGKVFLPSGAPTVAGEATAHVQ